MYTVHQTSPEPHLDLGQTADQRDALDRIDDQCRQLHSSADDTAGPYHFEIRRDGHAIIWLMYEPDRSQPYRSVALDELTGAP
jgi:hypothetical protein